MAAAEAPALLLVRSELDPKLHPFARLTMDPEIKNPISLARLLLDYSATQLSLRRVPPNFLTGQGATNFAYERGLPVVPHDMLVSPAARDRWKRWNADLRAADQKERLAEAARYGISPPRSDSETDLYQEQMEQDQARHSHTKAMQQGLFNEAQPISPPPMSQPPISPPRSLSRETGPASSSPSHGSLASQERRTSSNTPDPGEEYTDPCGPPGFFSRTTASALASSIAGPAGSTIPGYGKSVGVTDGGLQRVSHVVDLGDSEIATGELRFEGLRESRWSDVSSGSETTVKYAPTGKSCPSQHAEDMASNLPRGPSATSGDEDLDGHSAERPPARQALPYTGGRSDNITDTVGAIAIDMSGNIACGASSGGIGMKHRGRIGPAALVGIGASVVPVDPADASSTAVATVTSGTGEHMGTTQAASTCSSRLFHNHRRTAGNGVEDIPDDEALRSFIERDFMAHPSVRNSTSTGAIGVLSVKKTKEGAWIYYAHNTDSFALASMSSNDDRPLCTMSRSKGNGTIAQGGRAIRFKPRKTR